MPQYTYQCDCGFRFSAVGAIKTASEPKKCTKCGQLAQRHTPGSIQGGFNLHATSINPQNTGVHDFDTNHDRVIGSSAEQGWAVCDERARDKARYVADNQVTGYDLARIPDGTYRIMSAEERAFKERERIKSDNFSREQRKRILAERMSKSSA